MSPVFRPDNFSRRADESDSKLVVTESLSVSANDVFNNGNKSSGEFLEDIKSTVGQNKYELKTN